MSLQPMAIADHLITGGIYYDTSSNGYSGQVNNDFREFLKSIKRVQGVAGHWGGPASAPSLEHIGPQKLPFDEMWMERSVDVDLGLGSAAVLRSRPGGYQVEAFSSSSLGVAASPYAVMVEVLDDSTIRGMTLWDRKTRRVIPPGEINETGKTGADAILSAVGMAYSIGLMNCRNVETRHVQPVVRQPRKSRRKRTPKLDYHTIVLPGGSSSGGGNGSGNGEQKARHIVRGHFATYTDENPLFGKYTGTYWKPWHVRGNAANGITVTDYRVQGASA